MKILDILQKHNFNGQVLLADKDGTVIKKACGYKDIDNKIPMTLHTRTRIASVSKQFTALAILQLAYEKQCHLDDTLETYFPTFKHASKITIHHLLSNTSGVAPYDFNGDYDKYYKMNDFYDSFLEEVVFPKELSFEPGSSFEYSGSGYLILTTLIEMISGVPFHTYMKQHLFEPLGMNDTDFDFGTPEDDMATCYDMKDHEIVLAAEVDMRLAGGGGGFYSTVLDLYTWNQSLLNATLLPKEWIDKLFVPYIPINDDVSYGYGLFLGTDKSYQPPVTIHYHTGGGPGVRAINALFVDSGLQLIMLSNVNDRDTFGTVQAEFYSFCCEGGILQVGDKNE